MRSSLVCSINSDMAGREFRGRSGRGFRRRANPHPKYQPLPPIPLPPRPGQSELSSPFHPPPDYPSRFQFQFQEHNHARNDRYRYSSGSHRGRSRGRAYFQKNSADSADISLYFNETMLEEPWDQLIQEFNQPEESYPEIGMEVSSGEVVATVTKPETLEIETIKDQPAFTRIQIRKQDTLTPLSEFKPELSVDPSLLEQIPESEPYIPALPREEQQEAIPLADELISPFSASESKVLATLSTNERSADQSEPSYEPYIPSDYPVTSEELEPSNLTYIPHEFAPDSQETPDTETNTDSSS